MTDKNDDTNEARLIPGNASRHQESMQDDGDFADDGDEGQKMGSEEGETADGELTPNDIFGLDPLDVLTLEELAEYLKVSTAAAHRVIKEQHLPGRNIGGEWRFLRDAVANWLRGQEAPAQQQKKAREDYAKPLSIPPATPPRDNEGERFSRPPQRPYQADQSGGGEYRPRQRFPEGGQQFGNQGGGQYGNRGGQSDGGQSGGGGGQYRSGNYGGGAGGGYSQPPRRPYRPAEGGGEGSYGAGGGGGAQGGGTGDYRGGGGGGGGGGAQFGGGGYAAGGQRFSGGPKRKNKRQVFDNERGKRLDRRKQDDAPEGQE